MATLPRIFFDKLMRAKDTSRPLGRYGFHLWALRLRFSRYFLPALLYGFGSFALISTATNTAIL